MAENSKAIDNQREYVIQCWTCLGEFDASQSVWCGCDPRNPTKLCPFCLQCFCTASDDYKSDFWNHAPANLKSEVDALRGTKGKLGEMLIRSDLITTDQLVKALEVQKNEGIKLGEALMKLGFVSKENVEYFLKRQQAQTVEDVKELKVHKESALKIGLEYCLEKQIVPLSVEQVGERTMLNVGSPDTLDINVVDYLQDRTGNRIVPVKLNVEGVGGILKGAFPEKFGGKKTSGASSLKSLSRQLVISGIKNGATDIYVEPGEQNIQIRYRIDGILFKGKPLNVSMKEGLTAELKKLGGLEVKEENVLQSGSAVLKYGGKRYELNVQALPTPHGQNLSLKIIDRARFIKDIDNLGIPPGDLAGIVDFFKKSTGLGIISGPIMNGTTTTMYSFMNYLSAGGKKVAGLESPVMTPLDDVQQFHAPRNEIDSMLQGVIQTYPDVIFISDLHYRETAVRACKAASRFLVFVVLEANSTGDAVEELLELGVPERDVASTLKIVLNQKLVRKICPDCIKKAGAFAPGLKRGGLSEEEISDIEAYTGAGCESCRNSGYSGRIPVFELMKIDEDIKKLILSRAGSAAVHEKAVDKGMKSQRSSVIDMIKNGVTTVEEFEKQGF